jgi:hypothetical protein
MFVSLPLNDFYQGLCRMNYTTSTRTFQVSFAGIRKAVLQGQIGMIES